MKQNSDKKNWLWSMIPMLTLVISSTPLFAQTEAERVQMISRNKGSYPGPQGSYASLMLSIAVEKGLRAKDLQKFNGVSMEFISIASGEFIMGSPLDEEGRRSDETQKKVTVPSFEIGRTEVTQLQYALIMGSNPSSFVDSNARDCMEIGETKLNANRPVERVSWEEAREFIRRLNEQDSKYHYRLPTEAEWEYAAREGATTPYSVEKGRNLEEYAVCLPPSHNKTAAVASKKANSLGLYDMHGNVWEWCNDLYDGTPKILEDSTGPDADGDYPFRVVRGASFNNLASYIRSALRGGIMSNKSYDNVGFRLARTPK